MPYQVYDLNPVDHIIPAAIGEPGKRVFYLQARKGSRLITVACEKEHVVALSLAAERLLTALSGGEADAVQEPDPAAMSVGLEYPVDPLFRIGQINLGYDEISKRLVIICYEQLEEGDESTPSVVRMWVSPAKMRAFGIRGQEVINAGRPTCVMCGEPIDPEGHFCPRRNGHRV
jgi:uncharacterized repeat protein (TIGR03847 family)